MCVTYQRVVSRQDIVKDEQLGRWSPGLALRGRGQTERVGGVMDGHLTLPVVN